MSAAGGTAERGTAEERVRNPLTWILLGLVRAYQFIVSPWLAPSCKYYPSCSAYAVTALRRHGPVKGAALAGWRLLRCNPWSKGGVDHVPPAEDWSAAFRRASTADDDEDSAVDSADRTPSAAEPDATAAEADVDTPGGPVAVARTGSDAVTRAGPDGVVKTGSDAVATTEPGAAARAGPGGVPAPRTLGEDTRGARHAVAPQDL
ncbi:membrane protein insertion efficiency factor YidD [Georgenia sp. TF02-10]|uniref:membrane protein insertion efficiency factor YidD n=1 Tax=Georgenia sp. TF02-10 TaxID=2917725 RepID=UPI00352DB742